MLLLLTSIAALIAVAVIQDTWRFLEYSKEVSTYAHQRNTPGCKYKYACCYKNCTEGSETGDSSSVCLLMSGGSDETRLTLRVLLMAFKQTGMLSVCCFPFSF